MTERWTASGRGRALVAAALIACGLVGASAFAAGAGAATTTTTGPSDTSTTVTGPSDTTTTTTLPPPVGPDFKIDYSIPPGAHLTGLKCGGPGGQWTIQVLADYSNFGPFQIHQTGTIVVTLDDTKSPPSGPASGQFHLAYSGLPGGINVSGDSTLAATATLDAAGLTFNGVSTATAKVTGLPIAVPDVGSASSLVAQAIPVVSGVFCPGSQAATTTTSTTSTTSTSSTTAPRAKGAIGQRVTGSPGVALRTDPPGVPPGGHLVASGSGCDPNSDVRVDAGAGIGASATADPEGKFLVALHRVNLGVGPHA